MPEITVFGAYVVAAALLAVPEPVGKASLAIRLGPVLAFVAMAGHGWLLWHTILAGNAKSLSLGNTVSLTGLMLALLAAAYTIVDRYRGLAAVFLGTVSISVLFTGTLTASARHAGNEPIWQFISHAVMAGLAYSLLAGAAILAIATALKDRGLRRSGKAGWTGRLPALEDMERHMFGAIVAGFVLLSLAIFSGLIFVRDMMAQHLAHKTVLTSIAWLVFGVLLLGRWRFGWRGRKAVNLTLAGFVILVLAYFGSRVVLEVVLGRQWG